MWLKENDLNQVTYFMNAVMVNLGQVVGKFCFLRDVYKATVRELQCCPIRVVFGICCHGATVGLIASFSVCRFSLLFPVCKVVIHFLLLLFLCSCLDVSLFVCVDVVADNHKPNAEYQQYKLCSRSIIRRRCELEYTNYRLQKIQHESIRVCVKGIHFAILPCTICKRYTNPIQSYDQRL